MHALRSVAMTTRDGVTTSSSLYHGDARHAGLDMGIVLIEGQTMPTIFVFASPGLGSGRSAPCAQARATRLQMLAMIRVADTDNDRAFLFDADDRERTTVDATEPLLITGHPSRTIASVAVWLLAEPVLDVQRSLSPSSRS